MECSQGNRIERSADNVIRVPLPEDPKAVCVPVQPGDTVILPFEVPSDPYSGESTLLFKEVDGFIVIEDHGATIFLEDYVRVYDEDRQHPVIVTDIDGRTIDILVWIAATDPNLTISH